MDKFRAVVCVFHKLAHCFVLLSVSLFHILHLFFFFLHASSPRMLLRELHVSPRVVDSEVSLFQASKTLTGLSALSYQLVLSELGNRECVIIQSK